MSHRIDRFPFEVAKEVTLSLPEGAAILDVQVVEGSPCVWALVDPEAPAQDAAFRIFDTGEAIDDVDDLTYVATFQMNSGALHMFGVGASWEEGE